MKQSVSLAAILALSAGALAGLPDDCEYAFNHPVFGPGTQYRWVATLDGTCPNIAIEIPDAFVASGNTPDFYYDDVIFTRVDTYDPMNPIGASEWDVDIYLKSGGGFPEIYARRADVSINEIRVHTATNGDGAALIFVEENAGAGIYSFDAVDVIERIPMIGGEEFDVRASFVEELARTW